MLFEINYGIKELFREKGLHIYQRGSVVTVKKEGKILIKFNFSYTNISIILLTLLGIKPAFYGINIKEGYSEILYVNRNINIYIDVDFVMFDKPYFEYTLTTVILYNPKMTSYSKKQIINMFANLRSYDREIGLFLGFPPIAVEDYMNRTNNLQINEIIEDKNYIGFNYYGIRFACYKQNTVSIKEWLDKKYNIPEVIRDNELLEVG